MVVFPTNVLFFCLVILTARSFFSHSDGGMGVMAVEQSVHVKGQVICEKRSMRNVFVELLEADTVSSDDSLNSTHTDKDGFFELSGKEDEIGTIQPYIRVVHNCDVTKKGVCRRITDFHIPASKIDKEYDMNFVNLNLRGNKDEEKCD